MQTEYKFRIEEEPTYRFNAEGDQTHPFTPTSPINITGASDYNELENKPSINGHPLEGDQSSEDLGINIPTKVSELENDRKFATESDIPTKTSQLQNDSQFATMADIPTKVSQLQNDKRFITAEDIPPVVTDLGEIDGEQYDWDLEEYLNTLQKAGSYKFLWDEFKYWVDIEALEVEGTTTVQQIYWDTEEGGITIYYRNLIVENGEIVDSYISTYMTFDEVNTAFARITHTHVRFATQAQSIWDYCNTVAMQNNMPIIIYFDSSANKTYLIETYVGNRQPVYKLQKVTEMNDTSYFCQRSSRYYSGAEHWGSWYKFTGEIFTPSR